MAEVVRRRYPHLEDSQNLILVDTDTNKRVWVNLTKVFKVESVEHGGMFGFRFFSIDFAVTPSGEVAGDTPLPVADIHDMGGGWASRSAGG